MKILIIEDEEGISNFLKKSLEEECFAVDTAKDGEAGCYMAKTNEYDLIVLDQMLPKKTGQEVCVSLRGSGKNMPIIMLSAQSGTETKIELLNSGADDYLVKPFSFEELLARVHALLRRPNKMVNTTIEFGNLTIDCRNHKVARAGQDIYLSRKEFMLLEYLLKNAGNVLSRSMIMEHVWDMTADPFSNTIESHILSLRKKIELKGMPKLIFTIPGRGYKIE